MLISWVRILFIRVEQAFINMVQIEQKGVWSLVDGHNCVLGACKNVTQSCELGPCLPC
jgi:hypothetical protein